MNPPRSGLTSTGAPGFRWARRETRRGFILAGAVLAAAVGAMAQDWTRAEGHRVRPLDGAGSAAPGSAPVAGFTRMLPEATGLAFTNRLDRERYVTNQIPLNGSGVALGDVDGDGACDVFLAGLDGPNALFRNLGAWRFTNITDHAGVALPGIDATGAALADLDGDRDLDLVVNTLGAGTHLLLNDGRGVFHPAPGSPFNPGRGGMSVALADTDRDGDLDLYLANYRTDTFRDQPGTRFRGKNLDGRMVLQSVNGRPVTDPDLVGRYTILPNGSIQEHGEADLFLRNEGAGRFTPLGLTDGLFLDAQGRPLEQPIYDWTLSVVFRDLNGDRAPDLYVCNDFQEPDLVWWNEGDGRFRPAPTAAFRHLSMFSMAVDVADLNRDGIDDLFTADMLSRTHARRQTKLGDVRPQFSPPGVITHRPQYPFNQLHLGLGQGAYAEVAWYAGLEASDWTWNVALIDVDLDGFEDALMATGHELDWMDADLWEQTDRARARRDLAPSQVQRLKLMFPRLNLPNFAFRNRGNLTFEDAGERWHFNQAVITHGMAFADLDGDGDADAVLNNLNDPVTLLRNDASAPRVAVQLAGNPPNTRGVGARISLLGGPVLQSQEIVAGGRYLSSDAPERAFAAGTGPGTGLVLEVAWPSGATSRVAGVRPNHRYEILEPSPPPGSRPAPRPTPSPRPLARFGREAALPEWTHVDAPFDDFQRQPLLPRRLSHAGPGVVCADLDGDGREEIAVGSGSGGHPSVFFPTPQGYQLRNAPGEPLERDVLGMVAWPLGRRSPGGSPQQGLLLALANWEDGEAEGAALALWDPVGGTWTNLLPAGASSPGPLAVADLDGDGDLDVFLGGRAVAGRYPLSPVSRLLRNERGVLRPDPAADGLLASSGMITSATWCDLEGDGFPDLLLGADWGPLQILRNQKGTLSPWDPPVTVASAPDSGPPTRALPARLSGWTGCWNGIASVDLDGDGRLDWVAGNWGLNSRWQLAGRQPLRLYHADFDDNQTEETLEAVFVPELGADAPLRTLRPVAAALPFIREIAPNHAAFSTSSLARLLGPRFESTRKREAAMLASVVFLNRGTSFEARLLPPEAQWSPAFAVAVADFNGDGAEDVVLSQNDFGMHGDAARQDAGHGLLLEGDGHGRLSPLAPGRSGLEIDGEQRGAAVTDLNADGRPDLVMTLNSGPLLAWTNRIATPGVRVTLEGPPGNPRGIGAVLRLGGEGKWGPARELAGGSGWLSQNGSTVVLARPPGRPSTQIQIRWPGGFLQTVPVPAAESHLRIAAPPEALERRP